MATTQAGKVSTLAGNGDDSTRPGRQLPQGDAVTVTVWWGWYRVDFSVLVGEVTDRATKFFDGIFDGTENTLIKINSQ